MAKTEFFRCNGATERADKLVCLSSSNYLLIFGFETDADGNKYTWRKYYDHKPTMREIKQDISDLINTETDAKILTGFTWNSKPVYLSTENQQNFKAAYDFARDTNGATLPVKFKLGEDEDANPIYHTFTKFEPLADFVTKATAFVIETLNDGWKKKDIDYSIFETED
jgi:hypothetical protein